MKIVREKSIRAAYIENRINQVVAQIKKSVGERTEKRKGVKSARNVCQKTGRARGIIK
jgi:hypothetical protein